MAKPMKIGLSLPYTFLASTGDGLRDSMLRSSLGPAVRGLELLKRHVQCIEVGCLNEAAPADQIVRAVRRIWSAGLEAIVHGHLPQSVDSTDLGSFYPWLGPLLREMPHRQKRLMLNVHALSADTGEVTRLHRRTVENLRKLAGLVDSQKLPVRFALELNRSKDEIDPSTTYEGVLNMCLEIASPHVGIGWDWGHTYANVLKDAVPVDPPLDFLERVVHAHIHDIGPGGSTHFPLTCGTVPVRTYANTLKGVGYQGYYILELYPERFADAGPVRGLFTSSVKILRQALE